MDDSCAMWYIAEQTWMQEPNDDDITDNEIETMNARHSARTGHEHRTIVTSDTSRSGIDVAYFKKVESVMVLHSCVRPSNEIVLTRSGNVAVYLAQLAREMSINLHSSSSHRLQSEQ